MRKKSLAGKLFLNKDTIGHLAQNDLSQVRGGAVTKAFSGCEYCSNGTSCDPEHTNFSYFC